MSRLLVLAIVLLAALALVHPVAAQSDVTRTVWYSRFKLVAAAFNPQNLAEWEEHISRNRINFVDTIPRDRSQQLLRTFNAMRDYQNTMNLVEQASFTFPPAPMSTFNLSSTGPYAWLSLDEYRATIGGLVTTQHQGETLSLSTFFSSLDQSSITIQDTVDYTARRNPVNNRTVNFAQALPVPVSGYGCKSGWAVVAADALSMYMQYQQAHSDKARARSHPRINRGLIASAQQLIDCAVIYEAVPAPGSGVRVSHTRNPCSGNTLAAAMEYITGRSYDASMPGSAPSRGLNPLSHYGPALSRGHYSGSRDVYQSRGYCAAEQRHSQRFYLDGSNSGSGYRDVGDLSFAIGYALTETKMELLFNYQIAGRSRNRTGPLISSVYAGSRYFQLYGGGVFQNIPEGVAQSCPTGANPDQPVLVMGYYNAKDGAPSYWVLRVPFGNTWGEGGYMKLAKGVGPAGICGLGSIVGAFLPPNYQLEACDALNASGLC